MKICTVFGITLSQLFAEEDTLFELADTQKRMLFHDSKDCFRISVDILVFDLSPGQSYLYSPTMFSLLDA